MRRRENLVLAGLTLLSIAWYALGLRRLWPYTADDTFISLRYARSLVEGNGLVYNVGERVEGYSNLGFTVALAVPLAFDVDGAFAAKWLGVAGGAGSLIAVFRLAAPTTDEALRGTSWLAGAVAIALFGGSITQTLFSVAGLETSCFVAAMLWGVERETRGSLLPAAACFALAATLRPEGALLGAVWCGARALQDSRRLVVVVAPLAVFGLQLAFRRAYYDAWWPQPALAKVDPASEAWRSGLRYLASWAGHVWPLLLVAVIGLGLAVRRRATAPLLRAGWGVVAALLVLRSGSDWMPGWRYLALPDALLCLATAEGLRELARVGGLAPVSMATAAVLTLQGAALLRGQREVIGGHHRVTEQSMVRAAAWLERHAVGEAVAAADIGRIGWAHRGYVLDLGGLTDAAIGRAPRGSARVEAMRDRFEASNPRFWINLSPTGSCSVAAGEPWRTLLARGDSGVVVARFESGLAGRTHVTWCVYDRGSRSSRPH